MPSRKRQSFCDVTFDPGRSDVSAWHFSGVHTRARRKHAPKGVDRARLTALIGNYWTFVDESIRQGVLDGDGAGRQKLFDELKARGSEMAAELFSKEAQREIWKAAAESDVFVISTNLADVPWEALFSREHGERGSFLSDHCVIQRQLDSSQELAVTAARSTGSTHLVCLDPILVGEEQCTRDLIDHLEKRGVGLHHTSTKNALENAARGATVIHWICEHAREGLRLQSDVFYSHRDVDAHRFPSGCVLFMLSCGAGRHEPACAALSAGIAAASGCTVVAPSSVVAAKAAVRFMLDIDEILHLEDVANLSDVWFRLKSPAARRHEATEIAARDCYLLWFGIHGDCDTTVGNMANVGSINVGERGMTLKIELDEGDFGEVMTPVERRAIFGSERVLQESSAPRSTSEMLEELLPRALVAKIRKLTPPDFELQEITIDAEVSGKIFGSGVTGNFSMKLARRAGVAAAPVRT